VIFLVVNIQHFATNVLKKGIFCFRLCFWKMLPKRNEVLFQKLPTIIATWATWKSWKKKKKKKKKTLELCVYVFVKLGLLINICVFFKRKEPPWLGPSRMLMEHWAIPTYMLRYDSLVPFGSPLYKLYLSMKEGSLFCFVVMRSTEPGCFRSCSLCRWKALNEDGCVVLVSMTFGLVVQKFLNIGWFLHWKLN
jgi:hypothetical protein